VLAQRQFIYASRLKCQSSEDVLYLRWPSNGSKHPTRRRQLLHLNQLPQPTKHLDSSGQYFGVGWKTSSSAVVGIHRRSRTMAALAESFEKSCHIGCSLSRRNLFGKCKGLDSTTHGNAFIHADIARSPPGQHINSARWYIEQLKKPVRVSKPPKGR